MNKDEVLSAVLASPLMSSWHWFQWHFRHHLRGSFHPFSDAIITVISEIDKKIPGFADDAIKVLASISGREKYVPHYEQLLQLLAEFHVIRQIGKYNWPEFHSFEYEPVATGSKKNPEVSVRYNGLEIGVEVKSPSLITHIYQRSTNPTQIVGRIFDKDAISDLPEADKGITLPRDNPLKDYLVSANGKFQAFKKERGNFYGILVVVWDDFIYEPISALLHANGGLFTDNSFFKDSDGSRGLKSNGTKTYVSVYVKVYFN